MDLRYRPEHAAFKQQVETFLAEHWRNGADPDAFRRAAVDAGYLYRAFPRRYGGSEQAPDLMRARIIALSFARAGAPGEVKGVGVQMLAPTLLECGADWQKERFIPKTLTGAFLWAQGYSEPNAGSDLASLRTRAELRGGQWVINGQKIWTSYAQKCRYMFALVRTEFDAPKREGMSYLLLDLKQPGVDIRPMRQITGGEDFNEVYFTDATTPADWIVGARGDGWRVSKSLLKHERNMIGGVDRSEAMFDSLVGLARRAMRDGKPAIQNEWVRDRLAALKAELEVQRHARNIQMSRELAGEDAGVLQLMNKLTQSNFAAAVAELSNALIEEEGLLSPIGNLSPGNERWTGQYMNSLAAAIAGGTSNIQRNIIAERGLNLPRDKDV